MVDFYIGRRLSYEGVLCTVRYQGEVDGTKGEWLGVEWDDPSRGRHSGSHQGKEYFKCLSTSQTAASFIRPTRPHDKPRSLFEGLCYKYAPESLASDAKVQQLGETHPIEISGKTVEEVGFDRIWKQLAVLEDLKIVLLDTLCIRAVSLDPGPAAIEKSQNELSRLCPRIQELDLSRNLLETWDDVANICRPLKCLRILKVGENRIQPLHQAPMSCSDSPFPHVQELYLNGIFMSWEEILELIDPKTFPNLKLLSLSNNELQSLASSVSMTHPKVESVILDNNKFRSLADLLVLFTVFPNINYLSVQESQIEQVSSVGNRSKRPFSSTLHTVNFSRNAISRWEFIDQLPSVFPSLSSLRVSSNPLYSGNNDTSLVSTRSFEETSYMLTLARLGNLRTLNYSQITPQDRLNGELYYISSIEREYEASIARGKRPSPEQIELSYPRYLELCREYDRVPVGRASEDGKSKQTEREQLQAPPNSLASRLVQFTFISAQSSDSSSQTPQNGTHPNATPSLQTSSNSSQPLLKLEIPRTTSTYSLKALLVRKLALQPLSFSLVYESEELDPVAESLTTSNLTEGLDDDVEWDIDPPGSSLGPADPDENPAHSLFTGSEGRKWKKREVEMLDSTREVGLWLDDNARKATVRIERC